MQELLSKYGLYGIIIGGLSWFILKLLKDHKEERKEWMERADKQSDEMNRVMRENTNILSGLKALLENRK